MNHDFKNAAQTDPALTGLVTQVHDLAREAGAILMKYYGKNYNIKTKDDNSPVTIADEESSLFLVRELELLSPSLPVVSEENDFDPAMDHVDRFWAIDPLDGTKEFIDQTKGFCIKIALIDQARPVLGVVYCPAQDVLYSTIENGLATKTSRIGTVHVLATRTAMIRNAAGGRLSTLFNQKHADPAEYQRCRMAMMEMGVTIPGRPAITAGLPRNLRVAEGLADLHLASGYAAGPLQGSGFIWDSAPDHLILRNAGGGMVNIADGSEPSYHQARAKMPAYLAYGDPAIRAKLFPEPGN